MNTDVTLSPSSDIAIAERKFELLQRQATAMSKSDLVPKEYKDKVSNCMIALEVADRLKASPLMVMQNLNIIHGRPSWSSTFIISAINSCGRFKPLRFDFTGKEQSDEWACTAWTVERDVTLPTNIRTLQQAIDANLPVLKSPKVSIEMAKKEGWYSKNGSKWQSIPELMLMYRPAAFFGRVYAPDVLMGMHSLEEVEDMGLKDVTPREESPVLHNINDAIRAEAEKAKAKITDIDPETGEITDQAATDSSPPTLSLQDWIDDIGAAPTAEGVDHKFAQAQSQFHGDAAAMASLTLAKTGRKQALVKPEETKAEVGSSSKKLFEKKAEGAAA